MPAISDPRAALRRQILARRDRLSLPDRQEKSKIICAQLWQLELFRAASTLFIYVDFRSEVETLPLIRQALAQGKRVAVPLIGEHSRLLPYAISDPERDLRPGYYQIPEPDPSRTVAVPPAEIEAVILPGSVFDLQGGRLGYGGGYYDRFLADEAPQALRIGIAFHLQVIPQAPLLPHDQRLHYLVTEECCLRLTA